MSPKLAPKQATGNAEKKAPSATKADSSAGGLEVGAKAPAFTLPRDGGGSVSLKDFAGRKLVLVGLNYRVRNILQITGVDPLFEIYATIADAQGALI